MNPTILRKLSMAVALAGLLQTGVGCSDNEKVGTSREVSHTESDKTGWFGGRTRETNTVYRNSDGSTSIETETTNTKGNTVTITREKKTTHTDGTVKTDRETRTIVKGTDTVERESSTKSN